MEHEIIVVTIKLDDKQKIGMDEWKITHLGKEKIVKLGYVQYYTEGITKALNSFKWDEIKSVEFKKDTTIKTYPIKL